MAKVLLMLANMNETREAEKKKVTTFGTVPMIIYMIIIIALVVGWFIFTSRDRMPPETPRDAQVTTPQ